MRKWQAILLTLLTVILLSANTVVTAEPVELTWYWCCGQQDKFDLYSTMAKEFEALNPSIKVNVVWPPGSGTYYNKVKLALATGAGPDVFWMGNGIYQFTEGFLLPLQNYIAKDANWSTIPKAVLSVNQWMGNLYGIPYGLNVNAVFYNTTLFNQAGVRAMSSWSWDDLATISRKLVRDTDGDGVNNIWAFSAIDGDPWWFYSYGGNPYDTEGKHVTVNNPQNVAGLQHMQEIFTRGDISPKYDDKNFEARAAFIDSRLAMTVDGPFSMPTYNGIKDFGYDMMPLPGLNYNNQLIQVDVMTPESFSVSATTKHPAEAIALLKFLTNKSNVVTYAKMGTIVPTLPSAMSTFVGADNTHNRKVFINAMENFRPYLYQHPAFADIKEIAASERNMAYLGRQAAVTSLINIEEQVNKVLTDYWAKR